MSYCVVIQAVNDELLRENSDSIGSDVNDTNDSVLVWYMVMLVCIWLDNDEINVNLNCQFCYVII